MINYQPGTSGLHRMPAGVKIIALIAGIAALIRVHELWQLGLATATVLSCYAVAGLGWRAVAGQVRLLRWFLGLLIIFHVFVAGWQSAVIIAGSLLLAVLLAGLITLTTRTTAMLDLTGSVLGPFRRFGVDPDRVGLLLALTIRSVPLVLEIIHQVLDARRARGAERSLRALAVPVVVRCLRAADALGEALIARGVDD